jgi:hypothetical protein
MKNSFQSVLWLLLMMVTSLFAAETIDRIVATVNGRAVMESELAEELRFEQFLDAAPPVVVSVAQQRAVLERLVDEILLEQQMDAVKFEHPSGVVLDKKIEEVRQQVAPVAGTDGWSAALQRYGLTEADVAEHIALQLRALHFIDARFRPAIRIDAHAVQNYYREKLLPRMKQAGAQPFPLQQVEPQIREILVQQQIDELLESWMKALRTQAEIRLPVPSSSVGAVQPSAQAQAAEVH